RAGARESSFFLVGGRRALPGRAVDDQPVVPDSINQVRGELLCERHIELTVLVERRDHGGQDTAEWAPRNGSRTVGHTPDATWSGHRHRSPDLLEPSARKPVPRGSRGRLFFLPRGRSAVRFSSAPVTANGAGPPWPARPLRCPRTSPAAPCDRRRAGSARSAHR